MFVLHQQQNLIEFNVHQLNQTSAIPGSLKGGGWRESWIHQATVLPRIQSNPCMGDGSNLSKRYNEVALWRLPYPRPPQPKSPSRQRSPQRTMVKWFATWEHRAVNRVQWYNKVWLNQVYQRLCQSHARGPFDQSNSNVFNPCGWLDPQYPTCIKKVKLTGRNLFTNDNLIRWNGTSKWTH